MLSHHFPFAVRLIGFSVHEMDACDAAFAEGRNKGYGYFRLAHGNLRDPDIYVANAAELKALITLANLRPSDVRPALLVGTPAVELPYARVGRPIDWSQLLAALDGLVEKRADALSRLEASDIVVVPERRRRDRVDLDLTDPAEYEKMRRKIRDDGAVLVVDKTPALRDYLADLLLRHQIPVEWASDEAGVIALCKQKPVSVVMINTSTPGVDPYRVCSAIKEKNSPVKIAVIFLISKPFVYDAEQADYAGADGFLTKPLANQHLVSALKKFLPRLR
jgi:CheY-like chemotaxis protein